jgi:hypothetical protein
MKDVVNPITLQLNYVDNNRPNFKGDPLKIPEIRNILIDHVTILGSRNAGKFSGIPERPLKGIALEDVTITAETDFVIQDSAEPILTRVTRTITPGVGPKVIPGEH